MPRSSEAIVPASISPDLPAEARINIQRILEQHSAAWKDPKLGQCKAIVHRIDTGIAPPIAARPRRLTPEKQQEVRRQVAELLEAGAIEKASGPWAAPLVLVPKKGGEWRMCVDYRELNQITKKDAYPLPLIDVLIRMFEGCSHFSTLDLKSGYYQVPMAEADKEKTAFITPSGLYQFAVMPFGLCNAPATFQRMVDELFERFAGQGVGVYIDDIVIYAPTAERHDELLEIVLGILIDNGLFLNLPKSKFGFRRVRYLGMIVDGSGIHPDPDKLELISKLPAPRDIPSLRRFLGTVGYFRQFITNFAGRAEPLTQLLRRNAAWSWTSERQKAFEELRNVLREEPLTLVFPRTDWPWILDTDASGTQVAAVLQQYDSQNNPHVVACASRCLTEFEQKWPIRELEAFAIVWAILHFAEYLRGQACFTVRTDHESLKWLWRTDNKRVARWALALQEFQFKVLYQKGSHHHHVDIFTRDIPITELEESLTDRIAMTANVFTVAPMCELRAGVAFEKFPSVAAFREEQQKEMPQGCPQLECVNGIMVNRFGRVFVPGSLRNQLMYYFHFGRTGGHQGITRTYNRMSRHFWWPAMKEDIQKYNGQCITCSRRRPHPRRALEGNLVADRPGLIVAIDIVGPVEHGQRRYYLFTIIDHFTKFAEAIVLTETTTQTLWQVFYVRWVALWGCPTYLLSDNGPQFAAKDFRSRCEELGIEKIFALPYHPQGNGVIESFHQFLLRAVSAYASQTSWPLVDIVASVLMAYRSTPHPSTSESPYRLMTGLDMVLPHFQQWAEYSIETMDSYRRFNLLAQVRRECFDRVLRTAAGARALCKGRTTLDPMLAVGDLVVYWLNPHEVSKLLARFGNLKFAPRWSEPCRIHRFLNKEKTAMMIKSIWHQGLIKRVHRNDVMVLPKQLTPEALNMAQFELISDLKRNAATPRMKNAVAEDFLRKIPAEDREAAIDRLAIVKEAWTKPAAADSSLTQQTITEMIDTWSDVNAPQRSETKKRRVAISAVWTHLNDVTFEEREAEVSN